jgi:hypothetical protein
VFTPAIPAYYILSLGVLLRDSQPTCRILNTDGAASPALSIHKNAAHAIDVIVEAGRPPLLNITWQNTDVCAGGLHILVAIGPVASKTG